MRTDEIENELNGVSLGELSDMTVGQFAKMLSNEDPDQKLVLYRKNADYPCYFKIVKIDQMKSEQLGALVLEVKRALKVQVNERVNETEQEKLERMKKQIENKLNAIGARKRRSLYLAARKKKERGLSEIDRFILDTLHDYPGVLKTRGRKPKKKVPEL